MNAHFMRMRSLALVLLAAVSLSACFAGDEDEEPMPPAVEDAVPASATTSSRAYTAFAATLPTDDSATPLNLGDYVAPSSETEAPQSID